MITILIPEQIALRLEVELNKAGTREIGGILMGEHVSNNVFRVMDFSIQRAGGTWSTFVRSLQEAVTNVLNAFFHQTNHNYTKYNYLGEWRSHPSFLLDPSMADIKSMYEIVNDRSVGANFAILMIVKMLNQRLEGSITLFRPGMQYTNGTLIREGGINVK